jgi:hypothetical protein
MIEINLYIAWVGILLGVVSGAGQGLLFHREDWLGGYGSWPRRMLRLGHISFFGLAFINLAFALSAAAVDLHDGLRLPSVLLVAGAISMPLVCYLSAWRKPFRHLFFIPVLSLITGVALFVWRLFTA